MSSRPVRSYRRRKPNLNLDLNHDPPLEENVREAQLGQSSVQPQELTPEPEQPQPQVPTIDVDAIEDDDVIECSPQSFALARNIARIVRRRRRRAMVDILSVNYYCDGLTYFIPDTAEEQNGENRSRTDPPNQTIIILEGSSSSLSENARKSPEPEPEPPREPVFNCPILLETSAISFQLAFGPAVWDLQLSHDEENRKQKKLQCTLENAEMLCCFCHMMFICLLNACFLFKPGCKHLLDVFLWTEEDLGGKLSKLRFGVSCLFRSLNCHKLSIEMDSQGACFLASPGCDKSHR
ncbi:hypothetical protein RJT34_07483 [Clitoria ternatea]|uniref:E3 ubiquitin-protein ligase RNF4 n=1 Tax=Clitoria ternatea TaxID=43366 RepID=A0AAN9PS87_CLITE